MVAVCPNPFRDTGLKLTRQVLGLLRGQGAEAAVCPIFAEEEPEILPPDVETRSLDQVAGDCTLVLVIGGDGTLLAAARRLIGRPVPILGVNLGSKGFMCALEPEDIGQIERAVRGGMKISRRMMLDVELYREGKRILSDCALNDAVLHGYGDCVKLTAFCDGSLITRFSGDGIVLATPTGSTGYSMSAGGPIVEPAAENILVSPICAHSLGARSFVLAPERTVTVKAQKLHGRRAYLSVDGASVADLANGDQVLVRRSEHRTLMADPDLRGFFETAYKKLS